MKPLEPLFTKNGIMYELVKRTDKVALFKLSLDSDHVGWEVCRISQHEDFFKGDALIPAAETIPGNEEFGRDGSKAFFPDHMKQAFAYLDEFNLELHAEKCPN